VGGGPSNTPSHSLLNSQQAAEIAPDSGVDFPAVGSEDWLSVSFYVDFTHSHEDGFTDLALRLDQAQAAAASTGRGKGIYATFGAPDEVRCGNYVFIAAPGGARLGGSDGLRMRWRLSSQHGMSVLLANMPEQHASCPNLSIQCTSTTLMERGFGRVWELMQEYVTTLGGEIVRNRLSRVDPCVDLRDVDISELCQICNSEWFITRAKYGPNPFRVNGRASGFTVGKTPLLLRVYDKLLECAKDPNKYRLYICSRFEGIEPERATRIEYQLSRTILKKYGVDSVEDWIAKRSTILQQITHQWFRLTEGPLDRRHTERALTHPLWTQIAEAFVDVYGPSAKLELKPLPKLEVDNSRLVKQVLGVLVGVFARAEKPITDNDKFLREVKFALKDVIGDRDMAAEVRRKMILLGIDVPPELEELSQNHFLNAPF
jgi:hypothetical protein